MGFYTFNQNNSGGSFDVDHEEGISHYVIVEGEDVAHVEYLAKRIGLYFDGAGDCSCCGDRWNEPWGELDSEPLVYDVPALEYSDGWKWIGNGPEGYIHYLDGRIVPFFEKARP